MSDTVGGRVTRLDAEGPVTVPEGTRATLCGVVPCSVALCGVSPCDAVLCDTTLCGVVLCGVLLGNAAPCDAALCDTQGTAAEVESEVAGDGQAVFLAASVAG